MDRRSKRNKQGNSGQNKPEKSRALCRRIGDEMDGWCRIGLFAKQELGFQIRDSGTHVIAR